LISFPTFEKSFKNLISLVVESMITHAEGALGWTEFIFGANFGVVVTPKPNREGW
jgi:hypothetical protein